MTTKRRALAKLAEGLDLPLATVEHAAMLANAECEPSESEILLLAAEFDSYAIPVLANNSTQELSSEHVSALERYVKGGRAILSEEIRALLKTSAGLRGALERMLHEVFVGHGNFALAPVAAASDGDVDQRRFEGGIITIAPAEGHSTQVYIVVDFDDPKSRARYVVLEADDHTDVATLPWDERFEEVEDGVVQRLVDMNDPEVERFVKLFRLPTSSGSLSR